MRPYDFILTGGGAAGLSLAYHLSQSVLADKSMLIIDREVKNRNDHTWCFWSRTPTLVDDMAYRTWDRLAFHSADYAAVIPLHTYRYRMIRAVDYYRFIHERLAACPNVDFLLGKVERVVDTAEGVEVAVNGQVYHGNWGFDSRHDPSEYRPLAPQYHALSQHFLGWEIETAQPVFTPDLPTLFDFRTPQRGAMRFVYVLPFSERRALVEYTLFSARLLPHADYQTALRAYLADVWHIQDYHLLEEEQYNIPMTDAPLPRRAGRHVMNIGTRGGRVKASTGYAFARIQRDSAAIVQSLLAHGHPFAVPTPPPRYRVFDAMLLDILEHHGDLSAHVFATLFQKNPIERLFRFLDEEGDWWENLQLMASVPPWPFIRAWLRIKLGIRS